MLDRSKNQVSEVAMRAPLLVLHSSLTSSKRLPVLKEIMQNSLDLTKTQSSPVASLTKVEPNLKRQVDLNKATLENSTKILRASMISESETLIRISLWMGQAGIMSSQSSSRVSNKSGILLDPQFRRLLPTLKRVWAYTQIRAPLSFQYLRNRMSRKNWKNALNRKIKH